MSATVKLPLYQLAHSRAGDKGNTSNISVIAWDSECYALLVEQMTEARVAEWRAQEVAKEGFIAVWAKKLATTAKKVRDLNQQYHKILYKQLQDAYEVYDNVLRSEHCDDFFAHLRGAMYAQGFKIQSNTTDSALIIRFIFGIDTQAKTVHDYSRALDGARYDSVDTDKFAEWLERKPITKVIEEQRAIKR
jgi:hypothetical protein